MGKFAPHLHFWKTRPKCFQLQGARTPWPEAPPHTSYSLAVSACRKPPLLWRSLRLWRWRRLCFSVLAFGVGRRACLGQTLALQRLFVFITFIVQRFHLGPPSSSSSSSSSSSQAEALPSCDPRQYQLGLILAPPPFTVRFTARNQHQHWVSTLVVACSSWDPWTIFGDPPSPFQSLPSALISLRETKKFVEVLLNTPDCRTRVTAHFWWDKSYFISAWRWHYTCTKSSSNEFRHSITHDSRQHPGPATDMGMPLADCKLSNNNSYTNAL